MKNKKNILINIAIKRHLYDLKHRKWKKDRIKKVQEKYLLMRVQIGAKPTYDRLFNIGLSDNTKYVF